MRIMPVQPHYECKRNASKYGHAQNFTAGTAVYAGTFDPITNGHLDLIKQGSKLFDKVYVLIAKNPDKTPQLPQDVRLKLIEESVKGMKNVEVDAFSGMTVDYAQCRGANYLLRGMRESTTDFIDEVHIASYNESIAPDLKTVLLFSSAANKSVSSSKVRDMVAKGMDIRKLVPEPVYEYFSKLGKGEIK